MDIVLIIDPTHTLPPIIGVVAAWRTDSSPVASLTVFSHGFMNGAVAPDGKLRITGLLMGRELHYAFSFDRGLPNAIGRAPATQVSGCPSARSSHVALDRPADVGTAALPQYLYGGIRRRTNAVNFCLRQL
ncbi:MAG: hypothetical protein U5L73_09830 [Rhodoferax sp.]|uniref:hypothetical protein n=1 Tax=Rhodoferax sp. TaxID=50421 RepID=UPI002ACE7DA7|nr:hypothetical protein [Rhodoferax sp.]MDZ7892040.1 hypothetical protein [Rhodoferax sp.]